MNAEPFSLLLPVYGGDKPDHLARAFRSCTADQTVHPAEVVVVVDGPISAELSTAVTEALSATDAATKLIELPANIGLANALERGLTECSHDLVARMDADDVSLPTRFERQLELMETGLDLVGTGMYEFVDEVGSIVGRRVPPAGSESISRYARFADPFNHPTVLYRRAAVRKAGGYVAIGLMEDYDLFARMIHSGARVDNLVEPLVMYRVGDGAYARRGGVAQLKAELQLQWRFLRAGFTSVPQFVRNILVRGVYRLIPEGIRRFAYRRLIAKGVFAKSS